MRRWAGRNPYYLQLLGRHLVEARQQRRSTEAALEDFISEASARLRELWRMLDERDRDTLRASLAGTPMRRSLRSRGLATEEGKPFGEVLVEWLREEA